MSGPEFSVQYSSRVSSENSPDMGEVRPSLLSFVPLFSRVQKPSHTRRFDILPFVMSSISPGSEVNDKIPGTFASSYSSKDGIFQQNISSE